MAQAETLRAAQCYVLDSEFHENIGEDDGTYSASIKLLMEELETGNLFVALISDESMRELTGLDRPLSSKEMVILAQKLRSWQGKRATVFVNPDSQEITMDMILAEESRARLPIETTSDIVEKSDTDTNSINLEDIPSLAFASANVARFGLSSLHHDNKSDDNKPEESEID